MESILVSEHVVDGAPAVMRRAVRDADAWYGWGLDLKRASRYIFILTATLAG